MISPSYERSSLVHDRCTTCGSLLPCVLHDRKMKREILSKRNEMPRFERVWEISYAPLESITRLDGNTFCLKDANEDREMFLKLDIENPDQRKFKELNVVKTITDPSGRKREVVGSLHTHGIGKTACGNFISVHTGNELQLFCPSDSTNLIWDYISAIPIIDMPDDAYVEHMKAKLQSFGNSFCLLADVTFRLQERSGTKQVLGIVSETDDHKVEFHELQDHLGNRLTSQSNTFRHIVPAYGGDLLAYREFGSLVRLKSPSDGSSEGWVEMTLLDSEGHRLNLGYDALDQIFSLSDRRFILLLNDGVRSLEADPGTRNAWRLSDVINYAADSEIGISSLDVISPRSFIAASHNGLVRLWTLDSNNEWHSTGSVLESDDVIENSSPLIKVVSVDPLTFLLSRNRRLAYFRIPPEKLRAYHERQTAQSKLPPLPSDL